MDKTPKLDGTEWIGGALKRAADRRNAVMRIDRILRKLSHADRIRVLELVRGMCELDESLAGDAVSEDNR